MRTFPAAGIAAALVLGATACSAPVASGPSASPTDTTADCIVGQWTLDADDLAGQIEKLVSVNTSVDDVEVAGDERLTFGDAGELSMAADLDVSATVDGSPVSRSLHASGSGSWEWVEEGTTLRVTGWAWDAAASPEPGAEPQLPTFDVTQAGDIGVTCSADDLTLTPQKAPVTGRFER